MLYTSYSYTHQCREDNDDWVKLLLHLANVQNFHNSSADQDAVMSMLYRRSFSSRFATQSLTYIQFSFAYVGITIALNLIAIVTCSTVLLNLMCPHVLDVTGDNIRKIRLRTNRVAFGMTPIDNTSSCIKSKADHHTLTRKVNGKCLNLTRNYPWTH